MTAVADMVDMAGTAAALGVSPASVLEASDPIEAEVWARVTQRAVVARDTLDEALAVKIANAVGKLLGGD